MVICNLQKNREGQSVEQIIKLAWPYLELPYSFESYSVGVGTVLAEVGLAGADLAEAGLAWAGSAGSGLARGFLAPDGLVVADSV